MPVLNCYSCPGALGACPIGAMQAVAGGRHKFSFYVLGLLALFGTVLGRLICGFLCPLGAFYALFNRFALYQMDVDKHKCIGCGKCEAVCPMAVKVTEQINCGECIRCGKCKAICPVEAIGRGFGGKTTSTDGDTG